MERWRGRDRGRAGEIVRESGKGRAGEIVGVWEREGEIAGEGVERERVRAKDGESGRWL